MENNKMFKSLYDRILSVKFLNTVLIGCAVMGGACSLSHPITDMTTKEKAWEEFSHPVDSTRTKVWWFHGETETTREGITADLEAYKRAGIGGVVYYDQVHGKAENALPALSPAWWDMLRFAASEAKRIGLSFEVNLSNGFVAGGPWITKRLGMQRLIASDTLVSGDQHFSAILSKPGKAGRNGLPPDRFRYVLLRFCSGGYGPLCSSSLGYIGDKGSFH